MFKKTLVASTVAIATMFSFAAEAAQGQGFVQVQAGQSDAEATVDGLGSASDEDSALLLRGGYYFVDNVGVEAFVGKLYDQSFDGVSLEARAVGLGLVAKHNFGADKDGFFLAGRLGMARGTIEGCIDGMGCDDAHSTEPYFGVGLGYDFNPTFGLGVNYDRYQGDGEGVEIDIDVLSLGAELRW